VDNHKFSKNDIKETRKRRIHAISLLISFHFVLFLVFIHFGLGITCEQERKDSISFSFLIYLCLFLSYVFLLFNYILILVFLVVTIYYLISKSCLHFLFYYLFILIFNYL